MRGTKQARWLRDGDRVTFADESVGTIEELPYLSGTGLVRTHVRMPGGQREPAAWSPAQIVTVESESEQGWITKETDE